MPQYDKVDSSPQVPRGRHLTTQPAAVEQDPLVSVTTDIPASLRKRLKVACAVHGIKQQDAYADALEAWLEKHPPTG